MQSGGEGMGERNQPQLHTCAVEEQNILKYNVMYYYSLHNINITIPQLQPIVTP